jgi:thiosulfate dehydrogenase
VQKRVSQRTLGPQFRRRRERNLAWQGVNLNMFKGIAMGILLGFVLVFAGAYFYFATGHAPVATNSPEMPFERKFAKMALNAYLDKVPHNNSPVPADEPNLLAGAKLYKEHCAFCHGLPGEPHNAIGSGMFPKPPLLFRGVGVTDDEAWESYTKISGGIRMSGMPGFKDHLNDTQMWQLAQLVKNADKLPASAKAELAPAPEGGHEGAEHEHEHMH